MIVYIVELELDAPLRADYLPWLREHVAMMLTLPGFVDARICERFDPPVADDRMILEVHYRLRDAAAFDDYLARHAARMRDLGLSRFGDRVRARRRVARELV